MQIDTAHLDERADVRLFAECAQSIERDLSSADESGGADVRWLLVTDSDELRSELTREYANKVVSFNASGLVDDPLELAIVHGELLSACDHIVMTSGSDLSMLAALKSSRLPHLVTGGAGHRSCLRHANLSTLLGLGDSSSASSRLNAVYTARSSTRNLDAHKRLQQLMVDGKLNPPRIVLNTLDSNGYGNRLYSMLSTWVAALLSDAAFFVRDWPWIHMYIEEPAAFAFRINETRLGQMAWYQNEMRQIMPAQNDWSVEKNIDLMVVYELPGMDAQHPVAFYDSIVANFFALCANPRHYEKLYEYGLVERETIEAAALRAHNRTHYSREQRQAAVFAVGYQTAHTLLNKHWLAKADLRRRIELAHEQHFRDAFVIGVQVRQDFFENDDMQVMMECALGVERRARQRDDSNSSSSSPIKIKWYVATDEAYVKRQISERYPGRVIFHEQDVLHRPRDHSESIIFDIELLSRAHELILTGGSTFGFTAAIKAARMPLYVNTRQNATRCLRMSLASLPARGNAASFK